MTDTLAEKACTPCRGGIPPLTRDQATRYLRQLPNGELLDDARQSRRTCRFQNFREALALIRAVGELARSEGHHPEVGFGWSHATVLLQTRKIKGRHGNDCILAARIDRLAGETGAHV
jgi:4a-hydroxytetrahydrobiopterin dehydratase